MLSHQFCVQTVNKAMQKNKVELTVGVLDIYGFEIFMVGIIPVHVYAVCSYTYNMYVNMYMYMYIINPRRACAARVTVVGLCVCLSVCLSVCRRLFSHYRLRGGL